MLRHIAKLLWNNRRTRLLLVGQILLSFLVLFAVFSFVLQKFTAYVTPLGFNIEQTYLVDVTIPEAIDTVIAERKALFLRLRDDLATVPGVSEVSALGFIAPFDNSQWGWGETNDGINIYTRVFMADEYYAETAELDVIRGRWFEPADTLGGNWSVVVNEQWLKHNFDGQDMVDSTINFFNTEENGSRQVKIIGVVKNFKYLGEFAEEEPITFVPDAPWDVKHEGHYMGGMTVRVALSTPASIEEDIFERVASVTGSRESTVHQLEQKRELTSRTHWVPILLMLTISVFLIINVALGLFGILINAIAKRRGEIGLRKAMGATGANISTQLTLEVVLVAVLGLVIGGLLAAQVYYLELLPINARMLLYGGLIAAALILTIVVLCALIPSSQAARIHPAIALRED